MWIEESEEKKIVRIIWCVIKLQVIVYFTDFADSFQFLRFVVNTSYRIDRNRLYII